MKRAILVFAFVAFDYLSTLVFCNTPYEEANPYARAFMDNFGITQGLTLFVIISNLPIYMIFSLDSNLVRLPSRAAMFAETLVDFAFSWFIAGMHFSGGASWFWYSGGLSCQAFGALLYLAMAFLFVKPYRTRCHN